MTNESPDERTLATHCHRWPYLLEQAAADPGRVVPGAVSAVILTRGLANHLTKIAFDD